MVHKSKEYKHLKSKGEREMNAQCQTFDCSLKALWPYNRRYHNRSAKVIHIQFIHVYIIIYIYKMTKVVRALWLAKRRVCMRVCKHGCGVKMFCFSRLITQAQIWKSFQLKTRHIYFTSLPTPSSAETWKIIGNTLCQFFFAYAEFLREKNPFLESNFISKQELITHTS